MSSVKTLTCLLLLVLTSLTLNAETDEETFTRIKPKALSFLRGCAEGGEQLHGMLYVIYHVNGNQARDILENAASRLESLDYARLLELTNTLAGTPSLIERVQHALDYNEEDWDRNATVRDMNELERIEHVETATRSLAWLALLRGIEEDEEASLVTANRRIATTLLGTLEPAAHLPQEPENFFPPQAQEEPHYLYIAYGDTYNQLLYHLYLFYRQDLNRVAYIFFILLIHPMFGSY